MPDFISKLVSRVHEKRDDLTQTLGQDAQADEALMRDLMVRHWHPLPATSPPQTAQGPAFAVDGSVRRVNLANGAYLFTAQAMMIGEERIETDVDIAILRGTTPRGSVERFADLLLQRLEIGLARDFAWQIPEGSVIFLDGALYGQLPQLYPLSIEGIEYPFPTDIIQGYLDLFRACQEGYRVPVSIAKTSREATHTKIWAEAEGIGPLPLEIPDSEMIYRWTDDRAGYSTPVILGTWGFTRGSRQLIEQGLLKDAPAIVSFFVRLADYDDAVRVDVPAFFMNDARLIAQVHGEVLSPEMPELHQLIQLLASDYGGLEVYNALLYAVDREVRLERRTMNEVYLRVIQQELGLEIRMDRSDRRF